MYHLMKFIPLYSKVQRPCTSTPMIDSFVRLMNEFTNMPVPPKPRQALGDKIVRDIRPGAAFEPTYIYRLLTVNKSSLSEKGRQEDAEEYLGFILNGLHEEMLNLKKLLSPSNEKLTISNGPKNHSVNEEEQEEQGEGSEDEWEQVGPRNKTSVTRQADFVQTPITGIFWWTHQVCGLPAEFKRICHFAAIFHVAVGYPVRQDTHSPGCTGELGGKRICPRLYHKNQTRG
uniref:cDNA FLJ53024, highly similar to Ubiquitin carboxyl-terminal hydrolase 10 n=1 Tax=Homo sapiens TaxID=9606 RepID=B4DDR4_HUMAN|nr:unnamed protein product [Homo sapiens]